MNDVHDYIKMPEIKVKYNEEDIMVSLLTTEIIDELTDSRKLVNRVFVDSEDNLKYYISDIYYDEFNNRFIGKRKEITNKSTIFKKKYESKDGDDDIFDIEYLKEELKKYEIKKEE